jgi:fimbrial chaperone protein
MTLSPGQPSELLKVTNNDEHGASYQIRSFLWSQTPDGTIRLSPSSDIVAFPEVFTLGPNETRNIRVGVLHRPGAIEETYRLIVQQLPPPPSPGRSIQILPGFDLPVYFTSADAEGKPHIGTPAVSMGMVSFTVADTGTAHVHVKRLTVTGYGDAGKAIFSVAAAPSYVLAGGRRDYAVQIAAHDCAEARKISILATFSNQIPPVTQEVAVPPGACTGSQVGLTGFASDTSQKVNILAASAGSSQ